MKKQYYLRLATLSLLLLLMTACGSSVSSTRQTQRNLTTSLTSSLGLLSGGCNGPIGPTAPLTTRPTAISWGNGRNDVFYIGSDLTLHHLWSNNSQAGSFGSESWGGFWAARQAIAATTWGPGRLDAFLVGQDHQLYHYWQDGGPGAGLEAIGGNFDPSESLAAINQGVGRLDLFLVRRDGQLDHYWQDTTVLINDGGDGIPDLSWHEKILGGGFLLQSPPSVVSRGPGLLDVFLVGADHRLYDIQQTAAAGSFHFISLGGSYGFNAYPASVHWGNTRADIFIVTAAGQLVHNWTEDGTHFGGESILYPTHLYTPASLSAISSRVGRLDLFLFDSQDEIHQVWQDSSVTGIAWNDRYYDAGCGIGDSITALPAGPGSYDLYFDGTSVSNINPLYWGVEHGTQLGSSHG